MGLKELIDDLHIRESELRDIIRSLSVNVNTVIAKQVPLYLRGDWAENGVQESVWVMLRATRVPLLVTSITFVPNIARPFAWCQVSAFEDTADIHTKQTIYTVVPNSTYRPFNMMGTHPPFIVPKGNTLNGRSTTAGAAAANHSYHYEITYYEV